jgi:hypothetical protein
MHSLCVEVEGSTHAFLKEACTLNSLYSDAPQDCAIKKCALSCVRRHDFDATLEMGVLNTNVVVEILGAISFLKGNDNLDKTGQVFENDDLEETGHGQENDRNNRLTAFYKVFRFRLITDVFDSSSGIATRALPAKRRL